MTKTVKDIWHMACPHCGRDDRIQIVVQVWAWISTEGTDAEGDEEWDSRSPCRCRHCDTYGTVGDFHLDGPATADQELQSRQE